MNKNAMFIILLGIIALIIISTASAAIFEFKEDGEDTIRIGYLPSDHDAALFVSDAKGYYEKQNITIDLIKYNNGNDLMKAMGDDEIDIGYVGIAPALYHIGNGAKAKIISSAQNEGSGIVVSNASAIESASDLNGKTIAMPGEGSIQELLLAFYLNENGISHKDLEISTLKAPLMSDALKNGSIDGAITFQPYVTIAESEGNTVLADSSEILPNHPCCVVVASDSFLEEHEDQASKVVEIHKKATKFINDNIENGNTSKIVKLLPEEIVPDKNLEVQSLESFPFTSGMSSNFKSNVLTFQDLEVTMGAVEDPLPQEELIWEA